MVDCGLPIKIVSGEESPTDGTAFIFGKDIRSNPKAVRRHVCFNLFY